MHRHEKEGRVILRPMIQNMTTLAEIQAATEGERLITIGVADVETTGVGHDDPITEFGLVVFHVTDDGRCLGPTVAYSEFNDPGRPIPVEVRELTGISDSDVEGKAVDWQRASTIMQSCDVLLAHNAAFDVHRIERAMRAVGVKPPTLVPWGCSMSGVEWRREHGAWAVALQSLCAQVAGFYLPGGGHRAVDDCLAVGSLLNYAREARPLALRTMESDFLVRGCPPYDRSGRAQTALKSRGYRWDGDNKQWVKTCETKEAAASELQWSGLVFRPGMFRSVSRPAVDRFRVSS